jgi:hypothetical protein
MRVIKFRGKDTNGKWHFGLLSISQGRPGQPEKGYYISNGCGCPWAYEVIPETLGQYTEVVDFYNSEIYECDIVKRSETGNLYEVFFYNGTFEVRLLIHEFETALSSIYPMKLIGNKFDNPELLKKVER